MNLPPLGASTELISCANGLKFKTVVVSIYYLHSSPGVKDCSTYGYLLQSHPFVDLAVKNVNYLQFPEASEQSLNY